MSHHDEPVKQQASKIKYWRSVEDLARDPNLPADRSDEFESAPAMNGSADDGIDGHSRREFFKLMGASLALMGTAACTRRPAEKIVPYLKKPEDVTLGVANWYASTCGECDSGCGILVKSREGRPIKFEGNPEHPINKGGLCARGQASVLNVYDPDRKRTALEVGRKGGESQISWGDLDKTAIEKLQAAKSKGGKVRILTGEISSPSTTKIINEFLSAFPGSKHVTYEPLGADEVAAAAELTYGARVVPHYHFDRAEMIVSFGADFLGTWESPVEFNKDFSKTRKVGKNAAKAGGKSMSRFVAFESLMTLTGTNADARYRVKSGDEHKVALALAHELVVVQGKSRFAGDSNVRAALTGYEIASVAQHLGVPADVLKTTTRELWEHRGKSLVVGGGQSVKGDNGVALEIAVNLLNSALENDGVTVDATGSPSTAKSSFTELAKLIEDMKAGQVDVLLIYKTNPVYALPKSMGFEEALGKVGTVLAFSMFADETTKVADYLLATPHHTEAWGDASPYVGVYSIQQPTISPLYQTRDFEESLLTWGKKIGASGAINSVPNWHEYLKSNWNQTTYKEHGAGKPFQLWWEELLREGFVGIGRAGAHARTFSTASLKSLPSLAWTGNKVTLVLYPKISQGDGRNANNGWLQELPDPVTKITWDNYASISVERAKSMGVSEGDILRLRTELTTLEVPAHIQPGMHDDTIAVAVGYGRKAGHVGNNIGVNVFPFSVAGKYAMTMSALIVNPEKTGKTYELASTQSHHSYEGRTAVVKEASLSEYRKDEKAGNEKEGELTTFWPEHQYLGYRWGMAIDLNSCTGCGACVIGCQSENNIPVVGKPFVLTSREMHWLRIDRYYSGKLEQPEVVHQPMLCQHCENAPCETVCPVLATMHDHEGLNQQVYNRCVGTRYCANNCPYKVRRFNWFTFTEPGGSRGFVEAPMQMQYNPDITVRTRGVMEKCTFCIQRIRDVKDRAKDAGIKVKDGELKTACQQSCPTDAIYFGNINDKGAQVSVIASDPRGYHVLEELNTRPSITYLTKIRNVEGAPRAEHHGAKHES